MVRERKEREKREAALQYSLPLIILYADSVRLINATGYQWDHQKEVLRARKLLAEHGVKCW